MARYRKMEPMEDEKTDADISSLIDCSFLLLFYFIVCTSLVKERKLDMAMPGQPVPSAERTPIEQQVITIGPDQVVSYGQAGGDLMVIESNPTVHHLPVLVTELTNFRERAESVSADPIVQFRVDGSVPQQRVVDVLNALAAAGITQVAMVNVDDGD